jgi:hypothetical protein
MVDNAIIEAAVPSEELFTNDYILLINPFDTTGGKGLYFTRLLKQGNPMTEKQYDLIVVGDLNYDYLGNIPRFPADDEVEISPMRATWEDQAPMQVW